jgi:hypothetical protein
MGTDEDDRDDWLQAGRALARVLLLATVEGVAASPLTQALDWPSTRTRMQSRLSLVGHPQMLLLMGCPPELPFRAVSGRRPVDEVLTFDQWVSFSPPTQPTMPASRSTRTTDSGSCPDHMA